MDKDFMKLKNDAATRLYELIAAIPKKLYSRKISLKIRGNHQVPDKKK